MAMTARSSTLAPASSRPDPPADQGPWTSRGGSAAGGGRRGFRTALLVMLGVLLVLGGGAAVGLYASSSVQVVADGQVQTVRTFAADVAEVLDRLEIEIGDADQVTPALDTRVVDGLRVTVMRASSVEVHVGDQPVQTVVAVVDTVADVLRAADLEQLLTTEARISPAPSDPIADGDRILVELPVAVTITADGEVQEVVTYAETVAGALEDAGVDVGDRDLVDPPVDAEIGPDTAITVQRVVIVEEVVEVAIEHGEQGRETDELAQGRTTVETEGRDGLVRETYRVTLVDGEETERELLTEEVVRDPTDRVVLVGTGADELREAQRLLADLGYPVGPVDGVDGAQTRRALCTWRRLEGRPVSRQSLQPGEVDALRSTSGLPGAAPGRGVTVDNTCQAVYYRQGGAWQHVHRASTGSDGLPRAGSYQIQRTRAGWHTSTLYPVPTPNMYNTLYFHGAIAIHGSNHVPPQPASAGCVRVTPTAADQLFAALNVGDPIRVIGAY